jgi:hypothetical protein
MEFENQITKKTASKIATNRPRTRRHTLIVQLWTEEGKSINAGQIWRGSMESYCDGKQSPLKIFPNLKRLIANFIKRINELKP